MAVRYAALCACVIVFARWRHVTLGNDNGTDRRTDGQTDGQTECDAICGPLLGRRAA